jgi:7-carboxy-7-deazaguanine synthase
MNVIEIFESLQGETTHAGRPCAFVRFAGCDLRCRYCDTTYAFSGGKPMSRQEILKALGAYHSRFVCLTGGEPTLQPDLPELCSELMAGGWEISLETHGQRDLSAVPAGVHRIIDLKTPGSGSEDYKFLNLESLRPGDEIKAVITSEADYRWAAQVIRRYRLVEQVPVVLSPAFGSVEPRDLARWLLEDGLGARLGLQIHKYVWGAETRGV